jgi:hypothetical protein
MTQFKKKNNLPIGCSEVRGAGIDSMGISPDGTKPIAQYITPPTFKKAISVFRDVQLYTTSLLKSD